MPHPSQPRSPDPGDLRGGTGSHPSRRTVTGLLVAAALAGCTRDAEPRPATTTTAPPPAEPRLDGTTIGWSVDEIPALEHQVIGTWMARNSWEDLHEGHWLADNPDYVAYVRAHPEGIADVGVPLVPHDSGTAVNDLLAQVLAGERDETFRAMGEALARTGPALVYARPWWEMNMRPLADDIDRAAFRQAWTRAVPLVREGFAAAARPGQSLRVVFCPTADGAEWAAFYPGEDVVDVVALDAYGQRWGRTTPAAADLLALVGGQLSALTAFAAEHGKPVALAEWGNVAVKDGDQEEMQGRGDFPEYIDLVMRWAAANDAEYLVYFNSPDGGVEQTLADTPVSLQRLQQWADRS